MSDLAAANCGCGCDNGCHNNTLFGGGDQCCSIIWILLILSLCGNCGNTASNWGCGNSNNSCLWIILLLFCCGGMGNDCC